MDEKTVDFIKQLLSVGVGSAVAILVILFVVRNAVATAVEQAGKRELEALKAALAKQLEKEKAEFARALDKERQAAARELELMKAEFAKNLERERAISARELEVFKSELALSAEVRRQVASRKVQAVQTIVEQGEPLIRSLFNASNVEERATAMAKLHTYIGTVRGLAHYFEGPVAHELSVYAGKMLGAYTKWQHNNDVTAFEDANAIYESMLQTIRRELGVLPRAPGGASKNEPPTGSTGS